MPKQITIHVGPLRLELLRVPEGAFFAGCNAEMAQRALGGTPFDSVGNARQLLLRNAYRQVELEGYFISRFAITRGQYHHFVVETGHRGAAGETDDLWRPDKLDHPVTNITFDDARRFCEWANLQLPTADEWEKAARGFDGRLYPWGDSFESRRCHAAENNASGTRAVQDLPEGDSPFGARQMCGNVWEWVVSAHGNPAVRGGSYQSSCQYYGLTPVSMDAEQNVFREHIGFRVVRRLTPSEKSTPPAVRVGFQPKSRERIREAALADMVVVPGGRFTRGLSESMVASLVRQYGLGPDDVRKLIGEGIDVLPLGSFSISRKCVSNEHYLAFVQETERKPPEDWNADVVSGKCKPPDAWRALPVVHVTREDAEAFCRWLDVRLPTSDEWEKAARGADSRLYPWGDKFDSALCNGAESGHGRLLPVDSLTAGASPYGLLNCCGNVFEWTGGKKDEFCIIRGGDYQHTCEVYGLAGFTMLTEPSFKSSGLGFRVAS